MSTLQFSPRLIRFFPFLTWFPISMLVVRADLMAGLTGALVLVPKAMAYAQLSGLPLYFGLYTAFVPAIVGALWGSSRQLATGPVAIASLMTAAAVSPLAVSNTPEYIGLALLLTLMVGVIQLLLGLVKLGTVVNFISHPVILGFMNAAAIIIGLSQMDMMFGIPKPRSDFFLKDIWEMFGHISLMHIPTLLMSLFGLALMVLLPKVRSLAKPSVLIAVIVTTVASYLIGFEQNSSGRLENISSPAVQRLLAVQDRTTQQIDALSLKVTELSRELRRVEKEGDPKMAAELRYERDVANVDIETLDHENNMRLREIRRLRLVRGSVNGVAVPTLFEAGRVPDGFVADGPNWRVRRIEKGALTLVGGGDVVGKVPGGLPAFRLPTLSLDAMLQLLTSAFTIALVAFMESISMAKVLASKARQHVDPNQELIGQGLANISGSFFQSYPACGSFTGSAVNLQAGAKTGFAMVFNGLIVALTLLFLTPLLYHLPKSVLAMNNLLAVVGLIAIPAFRHVWKASRADAVVAVTTFVVTLLAAPHLDKGIIVGTLLAIGLYLHKTMAPRVAILGRFEDGTLRDVNVRANLTTSPLVTVMRFDGSLYFADVSYFEDAVLKAVADHKQSRYLLVMGDAINFMDASGEEMLQNLVVQLHDVGVELVFSGLKKQVLDVMRTTGLADVIGEQNIFANECQALKDIFDRLGEDAQGDALYSYVHVASC